jgi:hypothetical protein
MLAQSLAEKRSVLKHSASVDRGSRRRGRVKGDKRFHAQFSLSSDSPHSSDLESAAQTLKSKAESFNPTELYSSSTSNAKGQLLSSILCQISDSHARKQQVVNFEELETVKDTGMRDRQGKPEAEGKHVQCGSKENCAPSAEVQSVAIMAGDGINSEFESSNQRLGELGAPKNGSRSTNDELELAADRLSLNDVNEDQNKNA